MYSTSPESMRCPQCLAPVGQTSGRCPLCGTPLTDVPVGRPFQPAVIGVVSARPREKPKKKKGITPLGYAAISAAVLLCLAVLVLVVQRFVLAPNRVRATETAVAVRVEPTEPDTPPLSINGVVVKDRERVDPTDILHLVRAAIKEPNMESNLIGIEVNRSKGGLVNLTEPNASVVYRFVNAPVGLPLGTLDGLDIVVFTLRADAPSIERSKAAPGPKEKDKKKEDAAVRKLVDPLCVWSAAWRSAVAAGLPKEKHVNGRYLAASVGNKTEWQLEVPGEPSTLTALDGETCAIRSR